VRVILSAESAWDIINYIGMNESAMVVQQDDHVDFNSTKALTAKTKMLDQWQQRFSQVLEKCSKYGVIYQSHLKQTYSIMSTLGQRSTDGKTQDKTMLEEFLHTIEERFNNLENYFKNFEDFAAKISHLDNTAAVLRNLDSVIPDHTSKGRPTSPSG